MKSMYAYLLLAVFVASSSADVGPYGYLKGGNIALASWAGTFIVIAVMSAFLFTNDNERKMLLACILSYAILAFMGIDFVYGLLSAITGYIAVQSGKHLGRKYHLQDERERLTPHKRRTLAVAMSLTVLVMQLGLFGLHDRLSGIGYAVTGFQKVKPISASISVNRDGYFQAIFINGAGLDILIDGDKIMLLYGDIAQPCSGPVTLDTRAVKPGDSFRLDVYGCVKGGPGTPVNITLEIPYSVKYGGIETTHTESGAIRGRYE